LYGSLLTVGGRNDGPNLAGNFPVRIGVKNGIDGLAVLHAGDVGLVYVDFDLIRIHVHDGGDAGTSESAARGNWRDHFSDLRVFGNDDAGEGCPNGAVVDGLLGLGNSSIGGGDLSFGQLDFGLKAVGIRARIVQLFLRLHAGFLQLFGAAQFDLGVA